MRLEKSVSRTRAYGTKTHAEKTTRIVASKAIGALNPHNGDISRTNLI